MTDDPSATGPVTDPRVTYLQLIRSVIPKGMTVQPIEVEFLPWAAPSCVAVYGTMASGEPAVSVIYEWPIPWLRTTAPLERYMREYLLMRRYSTDQALGYGAPAFSDIQPGDNPPDATAQTDDGRIGVESTALTIPRRRRAQALFRAFRSRVQSVDAGAFPRLGGCHIHVWFDGDDRFPGLPHRRSDDEAIDALLQGLAQYVPDDNALKIPGAGVPDPTPAPPTATTEAGATFYAVRMLAAAPNTMLFTLHGFELGLAYTTIVTAAETWTEVERLVAAHDQPGVDYLLITAAGPDETGVVFPAEDAIARLLIDNPIGLSTAPEHIKRVVLHSWSSGIGATLFPDVTQWFGPLYRPLVPSFQPIHDEGADDADEESPASGA